MKNFNKGWVTSGLGLVIIALVIVHFFGIYEFPHPSSLTTNQTSGIAFVIGLALFLVPASKIEEWIENIVKKKSDKIQ